MGKRSHRNRNHGRRGPSGLVVESCDVCGEVLLPSIEGYSITTIANPQPGIPQALMLAHVECMERWEVEFRSEHPNVPWDHTTHECERELHQHLHAILGDDDHHGHAA